MIIKKTKTLLEKKAREKQPLYITKKKMVLTTQQMRNRMKEGKKKARMKKRLCMIQMMSIAMSCVKVKKKKTRRGYGVEVVLFIDEESMLLESEICEGRGSGLIF